MHVVAWSYGQSCLSCNTPFVRKSELAAVCESGSDDRFRFFDKHMFSWSGIINHMPIDVYVQNALQHSTPVKGDQSAYLPSFYAIALSTARVVTMNRTAVSFTVKHIVYMQR